MWWEIKIIVTGVLVFLIGAAMANSPKIKPLDEAKDRGDRVFAGGTLGFLVVGLLAIIVGLCGLFVRMWLS